MPAPSAPHDGGPVWSTNETTGGAVMQAVVAGSLERPLAGLRPSGRPHRLVWVWLWVGVAIGTAIFVGTQVADGDIAGLLVRSLAAARRLVGHPSWQYLPIVISIAGVHYVLAAVAVRAAAGSRSQIRLGEATLVQFVATVANRITPAGLGGAAINVRYLSRRGLTVSGAIGAVASLG